MAYSSPKTLYAFNEQIEYLENLNGEEFADWLKRALKGNEDPISLDREEEVPAWLTTQSMRKSELINRKITQTVPSLLRNFSLETDGPDFLCNLLWLAEVYRINESYDYLIGSLQNGSYRGVRTKDSRISYFGDLHMYVCRALMSVAPDNDERLREICLREIGGNDPGLGIFYAALLRKFDDSSQYIKKYFPAFVAFSMTNETCDLGNFLFFHFYENTKNKECFTRDMRSILGDLSGDQLNFLAREAEARKTRIETRRPVLSGDEAANNEKSPDDFHSFLITVLDNIREIKATGPIPPGERATVRYSSMKIGNTGHKSPKVS